jgi:hypothetical protein
MRVGYCARENPGTPTFEVPDVIGPGLVLRNVHARRAVLAKPTRVAKLIRTSKNFSILSMSFITLCAFCSLHMVVLSPEVGDWWDHPIDAVENDRELGKCRTGPRQHQLSEKGEFLGFRTVVFA